MTSRSSWVVCIQDSGGLWVEDSTIYRPNDTLPIGIESRLAPFDLADGSIGTVISSNKYTYSALSLQWKQIYYTDTILTTLDYYIQNATYVLLIDHLANTYYGTFTNLTKPFLVGEDNYFDISATFYRH